MPAAAVIPAPIAYTNVVAVKKLVVGSRWPGGGSAYGRYCPCLSHDVWRRPRGALQRVFRRRCRVYFEKIRVLKAGLTRLDIRAWNNGIGRRFYFVGGRKST